MDQEIKQILSIFKYDGEPYSCTPYGNSNINKIPDGYDIIELPATQYLMFQGEPLKKITSRQFRKFGSQKRNMTRLLSAISGTIQTRRFNLSQLERENI